MSDEQKPDGKPRVAAPQGSAAKPPATMAVDAWDDELVHQLQQQFGEQITEFSSYLAQKFLVCSPQAAVPIIEYLKLEAGFDYLVDLTAVDYPKRPERFELVYILYSYARNERVRVKTSIADGYKPHSAVGVHLAANWLEREVFDMFGIEFEGHPDLKRILMPEGWEGHPLRKDRAITQMDNQWVKEHLGIESGQ